MSNLDLKLVGTPQASPPDAIPRGDPGTVPSTSSQHQGFVALAAIAGRFRIAADPGQLQHELGLIDRPPENDDIVRAARRLGLKAKALQVARPGRLASIPMPFLVLLGEEGHWICDARNAEEQLRLTNPATHETRFLSSAELLSSSGGAIVLVTRRAGAAGVDPVVFSLKWFLPSIWRYRRALSHVLVGSLFIQLFGLITPMFFQLIIDKVLVHKSASTLMVLTIGLLGIGLFDVCLQHLRTFVLSHTTSRIDVELGARLFDHLLRLPLNYFETRAAGQTVARMRELETIRSFLTGQGLSSAIDLLFTALFIAVLFLYSTKLTIIVLLSIPLYALTAMLIRPLLRNKIEDKFNRGAETQQFLVEAVVGVQTLKAAAVEPILRNEWEEKLAAYVKTSLTAVMLGAAGQNIIQYVNKATSALVLFFGAQAVISGDMTIGALVAYNMIMMRVTAPILRLSQLWQDFQQTLISIERLGDILNAAPESRALASANLAPAQGAIAIKNVTFRYRPGLAPVLREINLSIARGEVIGIVGASGSGKSTLTKLMQRLYVPEQGQILVDGIDITQVDPAWLRRQIGVVLQENLLFNRSIHDNIALANPAMPRNQVIERARLAGADEFISKLPLGYDTKIEERGANLSGGQRQRIAIARALATNPRILIFDEATSALDYESEHIIQSNMRHIVQGRTVIIIAHRLAAVRGCHRIIAMHDGRIVEEGSHDVLIRREQGVYAKLWSLQSGMPARGHP